jgi:hypothetical protein
MPFCDGFQAIYDEIRMLCISRFVVVRPTVDLHHRVGRRWPWIIVAVREQAASGRQHGSPLSHVEAQAAAIMRLVTRLVGQHHRRLLIRRAGSRRAQAFAGARKKTAAIAAAGARQRAPQRSHSTAARPPTGGSMRRWEGSRRCRHLFTLTHCTALPSPCCASSLVLRSVWCRR